MTNRSIAKAAIIYEGKIFVGLRHGEVGILMVSNGDCPRPFPGGDAQGFTTNTGEFVSREVAAKIAVEAGQCKAEEVRGGRLYSEEVW